MMAGRWQRKCSDSVCVWVPRDHKNRSMTTVECVSVCVCVCVVSPGTVVCDDHFYDCGGAVCFPSKARVFSYGGNK